MRLLLILLLVFIFLNGYSQNSIKDGILGSWTLISFRITDPFYCGPDRDPTAKNGQQFVFYKLKDFILNPSEKDRKDMNVINGTWEINNENALIISFAEQILEFKIRFTSTKLFLRNRMMELELEKNY